MKVGMFIFALLILVLIGCSIPKYFVDERAVQKEKEDREAIDRWNYIYSYAIITQPDWLAIVIADEVTRYTEKQKLDSYIVARKIWKETRYKTGLVSRIKVWTRASAATNAPWIQVEQDCAYGLFQVNLSCWKHLLLMINNGALVSQIKTDDDYKKFIFYITYNADVGTRILRHYLDMFGGRYDYALTAYMAGENSDESIQLRKHGVRNEYIDDILNGPAYEEKMRIFNNWKLVERKVYVKQPKTPVNLITLVSYYKNGFK